jgi:hypothetical protein
MVCVAFVEVVAVGERISDGSSVLRTSQLRVALVGFVDYEWPPGRESGRSVQFRPRPRPFDFISAWARPCFCPRRFLNACSTLRGLESRGLPRE